MSNVYLATFGADFQEKSKRLLLPIFGNVVRAEVEIFDLIAHIVKNARIITMQNSC